MRRYWMGYAALAVAVFALLWTGAEAWADELVVDMNATPATGGHPFNYLIGSEWRCPSTQLGASVQRQDSETYAGWHVSATAVEHGLELYGQCRREQLKDMFIAEVGARAKVKPWLYVGVGEAWFDSNLRDRKFMATARGGGNLGMLRDYLKPITATADGGVHSDDAWRIALDTSLQTMKVGPATFAPAWRWSEQHEPGGRIVNDYRLTGRVTLPL